MRKQTITFYCDLCQTQVSSDSAFTNLTLGVYKYEVCIDCSGVLEKCIKSLRSSYPVYHGG